MAGRAVPGDDEGAEAAKASCEGVNERMSPKALWNAHRLLSSILKEAVEAEPPLRGRTRARW